MKRREWRVRYGGIGVVVAIGTRVVPGRKIGRRALAGPPTELRSTATTTRAAVGRDVSRVFV
ncbi:hypothetical protein SAMN05421543_105177 [Alicyclobacillus macrosporangiidus]|uniref:Uncharacterized protein n=1 Tax=Alicyclobacillus macrosporangiidus TaxID=392015 RepID=A0A1I7HYT7_9BACL|nr:hypothetical protein SAMN05421543_105177 [Alicyclobacillus macrosporangiidus]